MAAEGPAAAASCEGCHPRVIPRGHPVGMKPRDAVPPAGWPLDREGRLECRTCHPSCAQAPAAGEGRASTRIGGSARVDLRGGKRGGEFCSECHQEGPQRKRLPGPRGPEGPSGDSYRRGPAAHRKMFAVAHPGVSGAAAPGVDDTSLLCLGCHDGSLAIAGEGLETQAPQIGSGRESHPVGVSYPSRSRPGSEGSYIPLQALDRRIMLPEGRVGCLSCHDIFGSEEKLLVMSNRESRLCYACHQI